MDLIQNTDYQLSAWREFVNFNTVLPMVNRLVANSWKRCNGRTNPYQSKPLERLNMEYFLSTQVSAFDLLSVSRPVMEDVYQYIGGTETAVILVNSVGYILDMLGDPEMLKLLEEFDLQPGTLISEAHMGTNAFGTSLLEGVPLSVVGAEHYIARFHSLAESAAPIFNPNGRPLGAFGLVTLADQYHTHTLGLAVAGARAIEGQRQSDQLLAEQNNQLTQIKTILATNSDGIVVLDSERVLLHINPSAENILGISAQVMLGRHISEFVHYPDFLTKAVNEFERLTDVEINLDVNGYTITSFISLRYVKSNNQLQWIVCTLRQEKDVRRLVQRQVGAFTSLKLEDIPGDSEQIQKVRRIARAAAQTKASILIRGEVGTGKNPIARAIHYMSPNQDGPFMIFSASSIPSELAVAELLGVEEGASSSLPGGRPSKFELANHGTLYFQDVDALPLEAQGILLNLIDLGIAQRLGSKRSIPVDVRVIASTSVDIEQLITQGNFRSDLYYRFRAFEIVMPPLRDRIQDLAVLLARIVERLSRQLQSEIELDPGVLEILGEYDWPGNIRELEAVLGRAAMQAGFSGMIKPAHLPNYIQHPARGLEKERAKLDIRTIDELESEAILRAAELCRGNASEMARLLGVGRTTLWRRLKAIGVSLDDYRKN